MLQALTRTMQHLQHSKRFATDLILQGATQRKLSLGAVELALWTHLPGSTDILHQKLPLKSHWFRLIGMSTSSIAAAEKPSSWRIKPLNKAQYSVHTQCCPCCTCQRWTCHCPLSEHSSWCAKAAFLQLCMWGAGSQTHIIPLLRRGASEVF